MTHRGVEFQLVDLSKRLKGALKSLKFFFGIRGVVSVWVYVFGKAAVFLANVSIRVVVLCSQNLIATHGWMKE